MSRRYGRQQRRKHREQIAALDKRAEWFEKQAFEATRNASLAIDDMKAVVAHATRILGENHVALPPQEKEVSGGFPQMMAFREREPYRIRWTSDTIANTIRILTAMLDRLEFGVTHDNLRGDVHFYAALHGKRIGYVISDLAIARMSRESLGAMLTQEIAARIGNDLAEALKKDG